MPERTMTPFQWGFDEDGPDVLIGSHGVLFIKVADHPYQNAAEVAAFLCRSANAFGPLVEALRLAYGILGDFRHDWPGRLTAEGQAALCVLRDTLAEATEEDAETIQNSAQSGIIRAALAAAKEKP